jgi:hypothetical protein
MACLFLNGIEFSFMATKIKKIGEIIFTYGKLCIFAYNIKLQMRVLIEHFKKLNWPYAVYRELMILKDERKRLWVDAVRRFEVNPPEHGNLRDYKRALHKYRVDFKEYNAYGFWHLGESERTKYLSERELKSIYRKIDDVEADQWMDNKLMTHLKFAKYMQRDWICPSIISFDAFCQFVSSKDCIVKPYDGSQGKGVSMVKKGSNEDLKVLYDNCINNGLLIEECVKGHKETEEFHPQSLNTIRVMTMTKNGQVRVVGCMFRMGIGGHVVDNASAGGIVVPIDSETGVLIDDGRDKAGHTYIRHPETGKIIKGFVVPQWDNIIKSCQEMASIVPKKIFAGWDVCVLQNGEIELIEVNSGPNLMGIQVAYGYGFRSKIQAIGNDLLGFNPIKYKSIWSRPHTRYFDCMCYKEHRRDSNLLLKDYIDAKAEL